MNARLADKEGINLSNLREAARLPDLPCPWAWVIMQIIHEHRNMPGAADFIRNAPLRESSFLVCDQTLLPALEFLDVEPLLDILLLLVNRGTDQRLVGRQANVASIQQVQIRTNSRLLINVGKWLLRFGT